ncbi:gliding motility-associated C-terminal domain-containing protein [Flavobacteriaceae bacterium MAR_2010_188]|nr:gliding motility-associated C-terminal domain-containing protein [Flavobacteriaceae bacterium MAR_2010_188]
MKKLYFILIILLVSCTLTLQAQQLNINDSFTEQQLVEDYLVQGCVEISDIQSQVNGEVNGIKSFGYFEKANSNFPFQNGIILSTGKATSGANGVINAILNDGQPTWLTDSDLESALGISGTLNATSIEFDFISISNQISFNYILASEEYFGNFPCEYSDGFALLIKRVDTNEPYRNIAVIPDTNIPVNTKTIHDEIVGFCDAENVQYFDGYNMGDTNYNGRTKTMTASADIIPNVKYHIKLVIADQTDKNYDSAVFIEGNSFNATVDLGEDITSCAENYTLYGDIGNPDATYCWYKNGSKIANETGTQLEINTSGTYKIEIVLPFLDGSCTIEDSVVMNLSSTQAAEDLTDYQICDEGNDGKEIFNLSSKTEEVLNSVPQSEYEISYHLNFADAENNSNPITQPITNATNPQEIHVRIRDIINGCLAYSTFDLIVNQKPNLQPVYDYFACDDQTNDGTVAIDLSLYDNQLTNGQKNLVVTYHRNLADANTGENPLSLPYVNNSSTEVLYANVTNYETGCTASTTVNLEVKSNPTINIEPVYIDACDQAHDGFATFDLTSIINEITNGQSGVTITFHESREDAALDLNPITDTTNYSNVTKDFQKIFIRVEDNDTGCASIRFFEIHSNLLLTGTILRDFALCDVDSGANSFDLERIADIIINEIDDVSIRFFQTEEDRDNQTNELNISADYTPVELPQFLYLILSSPTCSEYAEVELLEDPAYNFGNVSEINICSNSQDDLETIILSNFDAVLLNGEVGYQVRYYLSEDDADYDRNRLPNEYNDFSSPQSIYARISAGGSRCFDVVPFQLNIEAAPDVNVPTDIIVCDTDDDGIYTVNLDSKIPEIVNDSSTKIITFYTTLEDAETEQNPIMNSANYYTSSKEIYVSVADIAGSCSSIVSFKVYINTVPNISDVGSLEYCEYNTDGIGDFILSDKDADILNGQAGKEVLYFENAADSESGLNPINKNQAYRNSSNPQTLFYRVQNITDPNCFKTSSFSLEVGTSPRYNEPTDWFVCDDSSNDQREEFDLTSTYNEIKKGIDENLEVSFYESRNDAEKGNAPIDLVYTNIVNPQTIFVRIGNGNVCNAYTSFELNVVQVPDANMPEPLIMCDLDGDQTIVFNLEDSLIEILDVRQNNIVVSYFRNMNDLNSNSNAINNPKNFTNTSNPQTVFVRLTNTVSNCYNSVPLELKVMEPPVINKFDEQQICRTSDGTYDISEFSYYVVDTPEVWDISYYKTEAEAHAKTNDLVMPYRYQSNNDLLFIRVENNESGCYSLNPFRLKVNPLPLAVKPNNLTSCDDDYDGFLEFDLSQQSAIIMANQNPSNFRLTYHADSESAEAGTNDIGPTYEAIDGEYIYARVTNNLTGCFKITEFMIEVNPLPVVDIPDQALCPENPTLLVSANTNQTHDAYLWSTGETSPEIEISTIGNYWVTVSTPHGCETTQSFNIIQSEPANIETTETVDFSDPNNITVTISGIGNYRYQLDQNEPQDSNVFERVPIGYHTVTIIDLNGCASVSKEVLVIDTPKFMTPNGDGYWDYWHIIGVETLPGTIVNIFDRYGKQLSQLKYDDIGWDGKHNGRDMPATDYWFVADVKRGGYEFQIKGHFALIR